MAETKIRTVNRPAHDIEVGDLCWVKFNAIYRWLPISKIKSTPKARALRPHGGFEFYVEDGGGGDIKVATPLHHDPIKVALVEAM